MDKNFLKLCQGGEISPNPVTLLAGLTINSCRK